MPTYEYRCNACSHEFEAFQSMKDAALTKCPKCGKKAIERLIGTGAAIVFKGSGFYQTDYRSESYKKAAEAETKQGTSAKSDAPTTGASDAKPDPAADAKAADAKPAPAPSGDSKPSTPARVSIPSASKPSPTTRAKSSPSRGNTGKGKTGKKK